MHASQAFYRPLENKTLGDLSPGPEALLRMGTGQTTRDMTAFGTGMMFISDSSVSDRMGIFCSLRFPGSDRTFTSFEHHPQHGHPWLPSGDASVASSWNFIHDCFGRVGGQEVTLGRGRAAAERCHG